MRCERQGDNSAATATLRDRRDAIDRGCDLVNNQGPPVVLAAADTWAHGGPLVGTLNRQPP